MTNMLFQNVFKEGKMLFCFIQSIIPVYSKCFTTFDQSLNDNSMILDFVVELLNLLNN